MKTTKALQYAVEEYQSGKKESFNAIYELSYKYLHTCVMHVVKNEDVAMDMLQETYLEISRSISQLKNTETFLSWAAMIANRKCFAYLKKQKDVLVSVDEDEENGDYFENIADDEAFIPEAILQDKEKQRLMKEIIDGLSDIQRLCVIGFYYNEQKQDEIAEELGIPVNTVKSHLNRAKSKIKEAVVELDTKKGTRLYSLAPFMLLFLDLEAQACEAPIKISALEQLKATSESGDALGAKQVAKAVSETEKVIRATMISLKTKVVIGVVSAALAVAGIGAAIAGSQNSAENVEHVATEEQNGEATKVGIEEEQAENAVKAETVEEQPEEIAKTETEKEQSKEMVTEESTIQVLSISGEYLMYGMGKQGLIPVCNHDGKYGLVTYDNRVIVPFEYDYGCRMVNEEGQSFFENDTGSYVFDKDGNQLFHTQRSIQSVKDGVIFTLDGSTFDVSYAYYTLAGEMLYECDAEYEEDDWATGYSEGYAFFGEKRMQADGTIESMTDIVFGNQNAQRNHQNEGGVVVDSIGVSFYGGIPLTALNNGFYWTRSDLISSDSYGIYHLKNADASVSYGFDFSSLFNRQGKSFSRSGGTWGLNSYFDDGCSYSNYGTLICPYISLDGKRTYYLIDITKIEKNPVEYVSQGEYWSEEDYWDYDKNLLTEEAVLFEAENIIMSNENYWLVKKDGQWGYIDHTGNVMGMYEDAAAFSNGKAIVIEDGTAYVIDESFSKVKELGAAFSVSNQGEVFQISTMDDLTEKIIKID